MQVFFVFAVVTNLLVSLSMLQGDLADPAWYLRLSHARDRLTYSVSKSDVTPRAEAAWLCCSGCVSAVNALTGVNVYGTNLLSSMTHALLMLRDFPFLLSCSVV